MYYSITIKVDLIDNVVVDVIKLILLNHTNVNIAKIVAIKIDKVKSTLSCFSTGVLTINQCKFSIGVPTINQNTFSIKGKNFVD